MNIRPRHSALIRNRPLWMIAGLCLGILLLFVFASEKPKYFQAQRGHLDLKDWKQGSAIALSGEWLFFPEEELFPADFLQRLSRQAEFRTAPVGVPLKELMGHEFDPHRQLATYVMRLSNLPQGKKLDVGLGQNYSYSRLFVFNQRGQLGSNSPLEIGRFPSQGQESEIAIGSMQPVKLPQVEGSEDVFVLVQIGNERHGWSGMWFAPMLGSQEDMVQLTVIFDRFNNLFRGLLLFTILYHTMFFLHHRRDKGSLYLAFFCACFLVHNILLESYVRHFTNHGNLEHELATRGVYIMLVLNSLAFNGFVRNYFPAHFSKNLMRFTFLSTVLVSFYYAIAPFSLMTSHWPVTMGFYTFFLAISAQSIVRAYLHREYGASFAFAGFVVLIIAMILDAAQTLGITVSFIPEYLRMYFSILGAGGFIVFQSQVIAQRYALALRTSDHLTHNLKAEVDQQTQEIRQQRDVLAAQQDKIKDVHRKTLLRFLPSMLVTDIVEGRAHLHEESMSREITVMFSDLCSFTSATEKLGPQVITLILNEYLKAMTDIVFAHQGTVDKFMGDGILVLFGTPQAMSPKEQVHLAITCAHSMQNALDDLNKHWQKVYSHVFSMRIGLHHGSAIVGYFGGSRRSDYTAIGQTVNIASRVEPLARPGHIMVTSAVIQYLHPRDYEAEGSFTLKGVSAPIELYRLREDKAA